MINYRGDYMDLVFTLRLVNFLLLVIIAALLFINRNAENQKFARLGFLILLVLFIVQFFIF